MKSGMVLAEVETKEEAELPIDTRDLEKVREFVSILHHSGYFQFYSSFGDGNVAFGDQTVVCESLQGALRDFIALFLLDRSVEARDIESAVGSQILGALIRLGLVSEIEGRLNSRGIKLIRMRGFDYFFQFGASPKAYFGDDSGALVTFQEPPQAGRALDLCSGPGIQALMASNYCAAVDAVEIDILAAKFLRINAFINQRSEKINIFNLSLEKYFDQCTETYDLILCNPPLLPIPSELQYPFVGAGGGDGLEITRKVIDLGSEVLANNGAIQFIGTGLGRVSEEQHILRFAEEIETMAGTKNLDANISILSKQRLCQGAPLYDGLVATTAQFSEIALEQVEATFARHFAALDMNTIFLFFCTLRKLKVAGRKRFDMTAHFYGDWFV